MPRQSVGERNGLCQDIILCEELSMSRYIIVREVVYAQV